MFTSVDLVTTYIARILEVNSTLHMVTEINPDALAIAAEYDAMRAAGNVTGPLFGVPVLIKNKLALSIGSWWFFPANTLAALPLTT